MRNSTHFWFSVIVLLVVTADLGQGRLFNQIILFCAAISYSFIALAPNYLETIFCSERCRHPATHHPAILVVFACVILLVPIAPQDLGTLQLLIEFFLLAYGSHLFLDIFTEDGIPLSITPTLFFQDQTKHYTFNEITKPRKRLQFYHFSALIDASTIEQKISSFCQGTIFFYGIQLIWQVINSLYSIEQILSGLISQLNFLHFICGGMIS